MEQKEEMSCDGNLYEEMLEVDKLLQESDCQEVLGGTHTAGCTGILTIYCC